MTRVFKFFFLLLLALDTAVAAAVSRNSADVHFNGVERHYGTVAALAGLDEATLQNASSLQSWKFPSPTGLSTQSCTEQAVR